MKASDNGAALWIWGAGGHIPSTLDIILAICRGLFLPGGQLKDNSVAILVDPDGRNGSKLGAEADCIASVGIMEEGEDGV